MPTATIPRQPQLGEWQRIEQAREAALEKCFSACETRDSNQFNSHIQEFIELFRDGNVERLFRRVIEMGWVEGTRSLLKQGADPKLISMAFLARNCHSVNILELLAEYNLDYTSGPPSILVWVLDRLDILDFLLGQGVDINGGCDDFMLKGSDKSYTDHTVAVLNSAAVRGDIELFDDLVARGAKPSRSNALHNATCSNNATAMISYLVEKFNLDVNADDGCGGLNEIVQMKQTPRYPLSYAVSRSNLAAIETLLKYGAKVNVEAGYCPNSYAIKNMNASALKLLLDAGADATDSLTSAIIKGYLEGARLCLEFGGDIAVGEAEDKRVAGRNGSYIGMSSEMRKLLDEWKLKAQDSQET